jgi:hypothetical protein
MARRPARYPAELREEAVRVVAKPAHPGDFDFTAHDHASASKACDIKNSYTLRSVLDKPVMRIVDMAAISLQLAY